MQGMEKIRDKILEEARAQAEQIIKEAEEKGKKLVEQASAEAEELGKSRLEKGKQEAQEVRKRMLAMAELEIRKEELALKQRLIDEVFDRALESLRNLEGEDLKSLIIDMVKRSAVSGQEEIIVSPEDREKFAGGLLAEVNSKLGLNLRLSDEVRNIQGGFILKAPGIEINNSFEALIRMERDQIETEIVDILFRK